MFLTNEEWDEYKSVIDDFHQDAFQEDVSWVTIVNPVDINGEDGGEKLATINLKALINYNYFRSWPMDKDTPTGEIDKESCLMYLNNKYLSDNGFLNEYGQFRFNPARDRFIIRGLKYKPAGDSQVSQINNQPLLHFVILKREEIETGSKVY